METTHLREESTRHLARRLRDETHSRIGGYRLLEKIGQGGMSVVYRASQIASGRQVALKVVALDSLAAKSDALAEQIFREASALAVVDHPHVIRCFGFGEDRGRMYMALEMLTSGDSRSLVDQGFLDEPRLLDLALECLDGLCAIHAAGFLHRDLKPGNIFITEDGHAKIADLGLAWNGSQIDRESRLATMGTPGYMSPEQVVGETLDARSDLYSLGATMYFWACGQAPFSGNDVLSVLDAVVNRDPPPLAQRNPRLSSGLCDVVATLMSKRREERYASAEHVKHDLLALRQGQTATHARPSSHSLEQVAVPGGRGALGRWWLIALLGVGGLALGAWWYVPRVVQAAKPQLPAVTTRVGAVPFTLDLMAQSAQEHMPVGRMQSGSAVQCAGGHLRFQDSERWAEAIMEADALTLEIVLRPARGGQSGPARILSWAGDAHWRNLALCQNGTQLEWRLRTSATSANGLRPHVHSADGLLDGRLVHLIVTRSQGMHRLYVDGVLEQELAVPGDLTVWNSSWPLVLGAEVDGSTPWLGIIERCQLSNVPCDAAGAQARCAAWQRERLP